MTTKPSNDEMIAAWSAAAGAHAGDFGEEGDEPRRLLLNPAIFALLGEVRGQRILDAGCGQGYLARMLARRGARVTGVEPAAGWYTAAVARERAEPLGITYLQADLSAFSAVDAGLDPFDAVIANMVLMDIPDDAAAIRACVAALRPGGSLIVSLLHPCFEEETASWEGQRYVAVREYLADFALPQSFAVRFHRPLSHYLNLIAEAGCVLRRVVEPGLGGEFAGRGAWYDRNRHVPSYLVLHATRA